MQSEAISFISNFFASKAAKYKVCTKNTEITSIYKNTYLLLPITQLLVLVGMGYLLAH